MKDKKGIWLKSNGTMESVVPKNGKTFLIEELQGFVGGYIEIINLTELGYGQKFMVCNEEGKQMGLPFNGTATVLFQALHLFSIDYIVGNVVICDSNMIE